MEKIKVKVFYSKIIECESDDVVKTVLSQQPENCTYEYVEDIEEVETDLFEEMKIFNPNKL